MERRRADARDAVGYIYARKASAMIERQIADARDAVADSYARKAGARRERIIADARDAVLDSDARKAGATIERAIADARHTIRYYKISYKCSVQIQVFSVIQGIGIITAKTYRAPFGYIAYINARKAFAITERRIANDRYSVGYEY